MRDRMVLSIILSLRTIPITSTVHVLLNGSPKGDGRSDVSNWKLPAFVWMVWLNTYDPPSEHNATAIDKNRWLSKQEEMIRTFTTSITSGIRMFRPMSPEAYIALETVTRQRATTR